MNGAQSTIFGTEEYHISNLKSRTFQVLERSPFLAECQYADLVTLQLAKDLKMGAASSDKEIAMSKATFRWITKNIPTVERYIRDFNLQHR